VIHWYHIVLLIILVPPVVGTMIVSALNGADRARGEEVRQLRARNRAADRDNAEKVNSEDGAFIDGLVTVPILDSMYDWFSGTD
jgi:hypothetical protein